MPAFGDFAATAVHSELKFKEAAAGYQYDWLKFSKFSSNLNLQVHYLDLKAQLRSNAIGTVSESLQAPVPTIGGGVPAGARKPSQRRMSKPGRPASATVGRSRRCVPGFLGSSR